MIPDDETARPWPAETVRRWLDQCYEALEKDGFMPLMLISVEYCTGGKRLRYDAIPTLTLATLKEVRDCLQDCVEEAEKEGEDSEPSPSGSGTER